MFPERPQPQHRVYSRRRAHCVKGRALTDTAMTHCRGEQGTHGIGPTLGHPSLRVQEPGLCFNHTHQSPPHAHACTHMRSCMHTHTLIYTPAYARRLILTRNDRHTHLHMHTRACMCTHTYMHTRAHTHSFTPNQSPGQASLASYTSLHTIAFSFPSGHTACLQTLTSFTGASLTGSLQSTCQPEGIL